MDDAAEDTEAVLAAYRERKRQALEAQSVPGQEPGSPAVPAPAPEPAPGAPATPAPAPAAQHFTFHHPTHGAAAPASPPGPASAALPHAPNLERALEPARHGGLTSDPGATLSALGPALRLSDALLKDRSVSVKGSPGLRTAGLAAVLLGLAAVVLDRRAVALGGDVPAFRLAGAALLLLGLLVFLVGLVYPRNRRLAVRLAASQREEWKRIQGESRRLVLWTRLGLGLAVAGLAGLAAAYVLRSIPLIGLAGAVAAAGLALLAASAVRRGIARRLYVQTMVLSGLEASGLGGTAPDERVKPVILALDQLLGALPEAEVQAFLASPEARAYLELVDEATRSKRGA